MTKTVPYSLTVVSLVQLLLAVAFLLQLPLAVNLWPFPGTTPLTFIFVSSIFAAAGASTLWAVASRHYGALAGIGLDYLTILAPVAFLALQLGSSGGDSKMTAYGVACVLGALFGLWLYRWALRIPMDSALPMPRGARVSFVVFITALLVVSFRLLTRTPNVLPWTITPDLSVVIGSMFLGAAVYFAYGLLRPSWTNSAGQFVGFLAYDLVLIVPFLQRLPTVAPEHKTSLTIYTAVVSISGLLAVYYLFINRPTRLWN